MNEITMKDFTEHKQARKTRESVAKKLVEFLTSAKLESNKAYRIECKDFTSENDAHYYTSYKALKSLEKIKAFNFIMINQYRFTAVEVIAK